MVKFFTHGMRSLAKAVETNPKLGKKYADKITNMADSIYDKASDSRLPSESDFNVINHGDFWVNNMLFSYDDKGKVRDHIFVSKSIISTSIIQYAIRLH